MGALTSKQIKKDFSSETNFRFHSHSITPETSFFRNSHNHDNLVQRKPSCPCGGGCPTCKEELPIQPKLKINKPGDKYEQEADRVAEQVIGMPEPDIQRQPIEEEEVELLQAKPLAGQTTPVIQQQVEDEEEEDELLQAKSDTARTPEVTQALAHQINPLRGGGEPLDPATRAYMEPRFGHDFRQVRIHTDARAAETAREVNALAYTVSQDIVFAERQYAPATSEGKRLLAHELTHVVQQTAYDLSNATLRRSKKKKEKKAEVRRLESEMNTLAEKNAWNGVSRAYDEIKAVNLAVNPGRVYYLAGKAARELGDTDRAKTLFERAISVGYESAEQELADLLFPKSEVVRYEAEIVGLARKNLWKGVNDFYEKIEMVVDKGRDPGYIHLWGAEAARKLGDLDGYKTRLERAISAGLKSHPDEQRTAEQGLRDVRMLYGMVLIRGLELNVGVMPFDPDRRKIVERAVKTLADTGEFEGLLPWGDYTLVCTVDGETVEKSFKVALGEKIEMDCEE